MSDNRFWNATERAEGDFTGRAALSAIPADPKLEAMREWRCFHCSDVFTSEHDARLHFGRDEGSTPACLIKGSEGGLIEALREAERAADDAIQSMHSESTDAARAYHSQRCRHSRALIAAEQVGYDRGLADGRAALKGAQ